MSDPGCRDDVCITCSDQLLEVVVTGFGADLGTVAATCDGVPCEVSIDLIDGVVIGERLLVHGGVALQRSAAEVAR